MAYTSDLCTGGSPYSGGDYSGEYAAAKAFDNSWPASAWASAQLGDQVGSAAFIGYAFASAKHIRRITVRPHTDQNFLPHFNVQYADAQGGPYTTVANIYVVAGDSEGEPQRTFDLPESGPHRYWRLMASEDTILDYPVRVEEIEMMGIVGAVTDPPPTTIVPPTTAAPTTVAPTTSAPTTMPPTTTPPPSGPARVTQEVIQVLSQDLSVSSRVSQVVVQAISQDNSVWARVSQLVVQVLRPYVATTTPPPTEPPTTQAPTPAPTTQAPTTAVPTAAPTTQAPTAPPTVPPTTEAPPIYNTVPDTAPPFTPVVDFTTPAPEDLITTEQSGPIEPTTECPIEVITPYQVTGAAIEVPVMTYTEVRCSQFAIELFVGRLASLPAPPDFEFPDIPGPEPIEFPLDSIGFIEDDV